MTRREFSKTVYAQIVKRAMHPVHGIFCEGCGQMLGLKKWHIDHIKPDGLEVDKSGKLTAAHGQLLGYDCCHKPKTAEDVKVISQAKRREAKHLGMKRSKGIIKSPGFPKVAKTKPLPTKSLPPRRMYQERQQ
jgi:hypothetical protein